MCFYPFLRPLFFCIVGANVYILHGSAIINEGYTVDLNKGEKSYSKKSVSILL